MRLIIKDKEGNKINLVNLDIDIAKLWNKELTKEYANPTPEFTNPNNLSGIELIKAEVRHKFTERMNWYDFIKHITDKFPEGQIEYEDLMKFQTGYNKPAYFKILKMWYEKPYFEILEMWHNKGYTIHNVL